MTSFERHQFDPGDRSTWDPLSGRNQDELGRDDLSAPIPIHPLHDEDGLPEDRDADYREVEHPDDEWSEFFGS